jgi:hypothetical protein
MSKRTKKRQAIVIIHGIGNQFPMDTTREFVENIKKDTDILYSSPDREANYFETRRLSLSNRKTDFYEFYWANLITEPSLSDLYSWVFRLLFIKKPSPRVMLLVVGIRFFCVLLLLSFIYTFYQDLQTFADSSYQFWPVPFTDSGLFALFTFLAFKFLIPMVHTKVSQTVGDAFKYLTPSPSNIESRYRIRKKGISLLKNLHEKKDANGNPLYDRIVLLGHSLGSVIAYDLITHLWHDYRYNYEPESLPVVQPILDELSQLINQHHQDQSAHLGSAIEFPLIQFRELQRKLFKEIKSIKNPWLISDFISVGSPLCHGDLILAKNYKDFVKKTNYREFPLCPPKIEVKQDPATRSIIKDYENSISFSKDIAVFDDETPKSPMRVINHSSQFAFIKWTNIYFSNDYVGGDLGYYFGAGIQNIRLVPEGGWAKRKLPIFSHTSYWSKGQDVSKKRILEHIF